MWREDGEHPEPPPDPILTQLSCTHTQNLETPTAETAVVYLEENIKSVPSKFVGDTQE